MGGAAASTAVSNTATTMTGACFSVVGALANEALEAVMRVSHRQLADSAAIARFGPWTDVDAMPLQQEGLGGLDLATHLGGRAAFALAQHGIPHLAMGTGSRWGMTHTTSLAQLGNAVNSRAMEHTSLRSRLAVERIVTSD